MSDTRTSTTRRPGGPTGSSAAAKAGSSVGTGAGPDGVLGWCGAVFADLRLALSQAVGAVAVGLLACVGLVVAGWVSDPAAATGWPQAVRLGASVWLLSHLGEIGVIGEVATSTSPADPLTPVSGVVSLPPLLLVLLAAWPAWLAGDRVAARSRPLRALALLPVLAGGYAGAAWLLAWAVDTPVVTPDPVACAVGAGVLALLGAGAAVVRRHGDGVLDRLPHPFQVQVRRVVPAAGVAVVGWLAAGALLLSGSLLVHLAAVGEVHAALAPGLGGGVALLALQLAYLPVAVLWGAAVLAGPGTWVGTGHVGPGGSSVVDVPAVPLLAALPAPGQLPVWAFLAPVAVVLAGALAAWHAHRHPSSRGATLGDRAGDAVALAALTGLAALGLGGVASGSVGPWGPLGPDAVALAAAVTAEVFAGALLGGSALHLVAGRPLGRWARWSGRVRASTPPTGSVAASGRLLGREQRTGPGSEPDTGRPSLRGR